MEGDHVQNLQEIKVSLGGDEKEEYEAITGKINF